MKAEQVDEQPQLGRAIGGQRLAPAAAASRSLSLCRSDSSATRDSAASWPCSQRSGRTARLALGGFERQLGRRLPAFGPASKLVGQRRAAPGTPRQVLPALASPWARQRRISRRCTGSVTRPSSSSARAKVRRRSRRAAAPASPSPAATWPPGRSGFLATARRKRSSDSVRLPSCSSTCPFSDRALALSGSVFSVSSIQAKQRLGEEERRQRAGPTA